MEIRDNKSSQTYGLQTASVNDAEESNENQPAESIWGGEIAKSESSFKIHKGGWQSCIHEKVSRFEEAVVLDTW